MPYKETKNLLYDFLTEPRFRAGRHMLLITVFTLISIGQSLFVFGYHKEQLGNVYYWYVAGNIFATLSFAYFNLIYLGPRLLIKNKYIEYFLVLIAGTAIYLLLKWIVEYYIFSKLGIIRRFNVITILDIFSNLTLYTICIASSSVSTLFKQWMNDTKQIERLKNRQLKNQVDELKNQVNPKFLSNLLDNISEIVMTDSNKASEILFKLSDVLRYELYDCKREKVLLESDIDFIDKYLSLEQINCLTPFTYSIKISGKTQLFVPSFIFMSATQKIIELQPDSISIYFDIVDSRIVFRCDVSQELDLLGCDFSKEEQRLKEVYAKDVKFKKKANSIEIKL